MKMGGLVESQIKQRMYANVKRVPFEWSRHQRYAKTPEGMGIHVLNIDGDIGPMLQANKLKGLKDLAAKKGRPNLTGAQIEVMNLSLNETLSRTLMTSFTTLIALIALFMLGGYAGCVAYTSSGSFIVAVIAGSLFVMVVGVVMERIIIRSPADWFWVCGWNPLP